MEAYIVHKFPSLDLYERDYLLRHPDQKLKLHGDEDLFIELTSNWIKQRDVEFQKIPSAIYLVDLLYLNQMKLLDSEHINSHMPYMVLLKCLMEDFDMEVNEGSFLEVKLQDLKGNDNLILFFDVFSRSLQKSKKVRIIEELKFDYGNLVE